ncbi:MAG: sterol desaturase family protein [Pyrinomonadaceae bacterium]|nr:sterol desaturase family protein [Pyrinomonadaceae bacterium]
MEIFSYFVHRFLFHGILWKIHQTHHGKRHKFPLELNDVFSLIFALISMGLMVFAQKPLLDSITFPIGLGIALYGLLYFILHDLFTHRRFLPFNSDNKLILTIRAAHQRHHQSSEKSGLEPYGLFLFDFERYRRKVESGKRKIES